ncbi:MAG TPA: outer membrane beta-barrel protein [Thermoanaerobaculaceae bacterium]|nr:outer membrane beta-barrel protein [Thermoanaerobaculaceae bacterium]
MRRTVLVVVCLVVAATWAGAQGTANTIELTPTAGYWFGDTISRGTINGVDFDVTVDDAPAYGVRLAYKFTPNFALEGFLSQERANLVTGHRELFGGATKVGRMDMTAAEANFEFSFGHGRLVPFIVGGFGAMRLDPTIDVGQGATSNLSADTRFLGDFGGGLKLFFNPQVALRFDWRGHSVNIDNSRGHNCDWWGDCSYDRNWLTFTEVGLGLTFVF